MNVLLRRPWVCLLAGLLGLTVEGCATPRVDWASRVGSYTYDQAILDYGPPEKSAKLTDGTVVAEWLSRRGYAYSTGFGYGYPWCYGYYYPAYSYAYAPDYFLRLTFNPEGRLTAWKQFYK